MRKVEPADVHAGVDELFDDLVAPAGGADRGDDFCLAHWPTAYNAASVVNVQSRFMSAIVRAVSEAIEQIAALNPRLNAFVSVLEAEALIQARALDDELREGRSRGPLHGLPVSIKDLIDVEGAATTAASRVRLDHIARSDATVVSRLRAAGAVIIGKCNLHEFALGTTSDESAFGPVRNPHDTTRSPGGSSGGSAAAVAADLGWASIGSDTGGSIRIPAAACGVVGLKPSFGEIPTTGVVPLSVSLDHVGPIARSVRDAWILYGVLKGTGDLPTAPLPTSELRLGKLGGYFADVIDEDVRSRFGSALDRLTGGGRVRARCSRAWRVGNRPDVYERRTSRGLCLPREVARDPCGTIFHWRSRQARARKECPRGGVRRGAARSRGSSSRG